MEVIIQGPWIFGPFNFLKIANTKIAFPFQFSMTVELEITVIPRLMQAL